MRKIKILTVSLLLGVVAFGQSYYDTVRYVVNGNIYSQGYNDLIIKNDTVYCVGYDNSCGNQRALVAIYDTALNLLSDQATGQDNRINFLTSIDTLKGEIIAGGVTNHTLSGGYNFYLSRINSQGMEISKTIYEKSEWYILNDIISERADSSIYSIGKKLTQTNGWQGIITKSDSDFGFVWEIEFGGAGIEELTEVCKLNDSSFVATGFTDSYGNGMKDLLLLCFSDKGNIIWEQYIGGVNDDFGSGIVKTNDGGIAVFGTTASFNTLSADKYIIKTDSVGNLIWSNLYVLNDPQNIYFDKGNDLIQLPNGDFLVVSSSKSFGSIGHTDIRIMKTDAQGWWLGDHYLIGNNEDEALRTVLYNDSTIFFVGYSMSYGAGNKDALIGRGHKFPNLDHTLKLHVASADCYLNKEDEEVIKTKVYPNPTNNLITVNSTEIINTIKLYSTTGSLLISRNYSLKSIQLNLTKYPSGIYFLHVKSQNQLFIKKIIITE